MDVTSGDVTSWKDPGHFVSEPVFVPRPPGGTPVSVSRRGSYASSLGGLDLQQQQQLQQQRRRSSGAIGSLNLGGLLAQRQQQQQEEEEERDAEDDGVLVFTLLSAASLQLVHLVVLDAHDLAEVARVTYHATGTVTQSLHGVFLREGEAEEGRGWRY